MFSSAGDFDEDVVFDVQLLKNFHDLALQSVEALGCLDVTSSSFRKHLHGFLSLEDVLLQLPDLAVRVHDRPEQLSVDSLVLDGLSVK